MNEKCFCCSGDSYEICCKPYHLGAKNPKSAEQLMRSRYSAFALNLPEYLIATSHPTLNQKQTKEEIIAWATENKWIRLEVLAANTTQIEFKAHYTNSKNKVEIHHELSDFVFFKGKWLYRSGKIDPKPFINSTRSINVPCPCGSGKKYKRCCG